MDLQSSVLEQFLLILEKVEQQFPCASGLIIAISENGPLAEMLGEHLPGELEIVVI